MKDQHMCMRVSLVRERDGQESKRDSTVPLWDCSVFQHSGKVHMPPLFHGVQCPLRASTLYLPERSLAWVVAFSTSQGFEPEVVKMGWHLSSPRYSVFRYFREVSVLALALSIASQYCTTAALAMLLTCCLVGCDVSHVRGWGSPYWRQRFLILQNHDFEEEGELDRTYKACLARVLSPFLSLHSCPNIANILR